MLVYVSHFVMLQVVKRVLIAILAIAFLGGGGYLGWRYWGKNQSKNNSSGSQQTQTTNDPSEGGKYLVIKEWQVRFTLPKELNSGVIYQLSNDIVDENNNAFQTTKIYISKNLNQQICALTNIGGQQALNTNVMIIRTNKNNRFNLARYKGSVKADVLADKQFTYHINYLTPPCADQTAAELIKKLENNVLNLDKF